MACHSIGSVAIFAGGFSSLDGQLSDNVDIFDTVMARNAVTNLNQSRAHLASVADGNQIYFAGGQTAISKTAAIESYDVNRRSWREVSMSLSQARSHLSATSLHSWMYLGGGLNDAGHTVDTVDMLHVSSGQRMTSHLSTARHSLSAVSVADRYIIFAGGVEEGDRESAVIDVFDTTTRSWSNLTLDIPRRDFATCAIGSLLIVAGGRSQGVAIADTWAFDFVTQQPVAIGSMPVMY